MKLAEPFSIQDGAVHYKGRAVKGVKVDASTFEVLGPVHARDAHQVFLVMETKLKPIKRADPATFLSLGSSYGRDAHTAFFREKTLRLKKGAGDLSAFRELDPHYATDGAWLYFGTQQLEPPGDLVGSGCNFGCNFDWAKARYRPFRIDPINRSDALFSDGGRTFLYQWGQSWVELDCPDIEAVVRLGGDLVGLYRRYFLADGRRVWFKGQEVPGVDPRLESGGARQVGTHVIEDGERVYVGSSPTQLPPGSLAWVVGDLYRTEEALLRLAPGEPAPELDLELARRGDSPSPSVQAAFEALIRALVAPAFTVFDRYLPVEASRWDIDFTVPPPAGLPALEIECTQDGLAQLRSGDHVVSGRPGAWYSLLSRLWAKLRGSADGHLVYVGHGTMLPDADALHIALARLAFAEVVDLAAALLACPTTAGDRDDAHGLLHLALYRADPFHDSRGVQAEVLHPSLVRLPREAAGFARFDRPRDRFTVTTNLAVAKKVVGDGLLSDPDPRIRWEAANLLNGVVSASPKNAAILKVALDPLLARAATEPSGLLTELWWTVLDTAAVQLTVSAEIQRSFDYALLETVARALIGAEVNVNVNRVRLVEALFGQRRFDEANELIAVLIEEERRAPRPTPGPYVHRTRYRSLESAALGARVRALFNPKLKSGERGPLVVELKRELDELREREAPKLGPDTDRLDLGEIADDLARLSPGD